MSLYSFRAKAQNEKFVVVLDAGHGGKDPGTLGKASFKDTYESHIALKVALQVGKLLANNSNYKTVFTRKKNVFIPLHKRGKIANEADANLFISIHCNAAVTNAYGTTTYVLGVGKSAKNLELSKRENDVILLEDDYEKHYDYDPNSEEFMIGLTLMQEDYQDKSIEFAQILQNKFVSVAKRKNRGVNQGNLAVLYDSYMPSVLVEIGFLSNKIEEKFLHTKTGQYRIAKAIYEAIRTYKKRLDSNSIKANVAAEENPIAANNNVNGSDSYYKIQIAASPNKITTSPNNFKKLKGVERIKSGSIYKYFYGETTNLSEAKKLEKKVLQLGYKDAFVKRFLNTPTKEINSDSNIEEVNSSNNSLNNDVANSTFNSNYYYTVQIATSRNKILEKPQNFKGLKNVTRKKVGATYKYFYGTTATAEAAIKIRKNIAKLGYKDAFVKKIKGNVNLTKPKTSLNTVKTVKTVKTDKIKTDKIKTNKTKTDDKTKTNKTKIIEGIIFKVQVTSGKRKLELKPYNFKGLKNMERVKIGSYYKYYYGKTNDYILIKKMHTEAVGKGYKDAKIVAIKNNKLVSVLNVLYGAN
ncbi:MAG: N-acetylmuramoyl-L-alanine amidase [Flavobacteriaceae bacterium]|nr:N-acetylmuramoyl-L-alanine amidase [Flavobacteriaceae bacterium]